MVERVIWMLRKQCVRRHRFESQVLDTQVIC